MHRFLVSPDAVEGRRVSLPGRVCHQIYRVLRLRPGDRVVVLDGTGWEMEVVLTQVGGERALGEVVERRPAGGEPDAQVVLYQSMLKRDNFEWVLQKCTELGVVEFAPVISQRTVMRKVSDVKEGKMRRWRRIIAEAVEQSGRGRVPVLRRPVTFEEAVVRPGAEVDLPLIPWEEERGRTMRGAVGGGTPSSVSVFIGPEGGFTADEIALAEEHGVLPVTLGPRILRAETAAVVATSLIMHELGELE